MVPVPPPLAAYVGKYVYDEVDGTRFLNHPQVHAAIEAAVPTGDVRDILYTRDAVVTPIMKMGKKFFIHVVLSQRMVVM